NRFDVIVRSRDGSQRTIAGVELPMPGRHNVQNALSAIGVALEMGMSDAEIAKGFAKFDGVKRRFTRWERLAAQRSSTIMPITRSKSALSFPPRAKAHKGG
ncbi:MAG: hypothetical protein RL367_1715, partial [Pseudomonadota bacterium]